MKHLNKLFVCLLSVVSATSFGQSVQPGYVKEYNERMQKTPLSDVEIVISNASSTASGVRGDFMLQFRTLKPGDKVNVRRIEKLGYEIFNKEALEQWFISRDNRPFTIVMCKSDRFKRIRDNYSRVSSESYEKQLKKEEARLQAERKAGKLKEAEYEAALKKLNDEYDQQLEDLDNYVDRFARIDLSELSNIEAEIIELVQKGDIEEAIRRYEQQNLEDKYKQQTDVGMKAQAGIDTLTVVREQSKVSRDSILAAIRRKNETLILAGGRENFEKVANSLKDIATNDTTNLDVVLEYAQFAQKQALYYEAERFFSIYVRSCTDKPKMVTAMMKLADVNRALKRYEQNAHYCDKALDLVKELVKEQPEEYQELYAQVLVSKGTMCYETNRLNETEQLFSEAHDIYLELSKDGTETHLYTLSKVQNNLGNLYRRMRQFDKAVEYLIQSLENTQKIYEKNPKKYLFDLASTRNNLGLTHKTLNQFDEAESCYLQAKEEMGQLFQYNPRAYREEYIKYLSNLGVLYKNLNRYEDAERYYIQALAHADTLYNANPEAYAVYFGNTLLNLGNLYNRMKRRNDSKNSLTNALPVLQDLYGKNARAFCVNLFSCHMSLGIVNMHLELHEEAISSFLKAKQLGEELLALAPKAYSMEYYQILKNLGISYEYIGQDDNAEQYHLLALQRIQSLYKDKPEAYENEYVSCLYVVGDFYKANEKNGKAIEYFRQAMDICQSKEQTYQKYIQKIQKAYEEMGMTPDGQ